MKLVSRADLARLKGVSSAAITKACRGILAPACNGDRIDLEHPATEKYLTAFNPRAGSRPGRSRSQANRTAPPAPQQTTAGQDEKPKGRPGRKRRTASDITREQGDTAPEFDADGFAAELGGMTLQQICDQFGTIRRFIDHLDAFQKEQRAKGLWLANEQTEGRLIERELVEHHLFGFIDSVFKRLLTDAAKTIAARTQNMTRTNSSTEDIEREVRELLSTQLEPMKATAARALRAK